MAKYKNMVITLDGQKIIAQAVANEGTIQFTKIKAGNGTYEELEDLEDKTNLKSIKQEFGITGITRNDDTIVKIRSVMSNADLKTGYNMKEIGLFAINQETKKEVLYAIIVAENDMWDYQPSYEDTPTSMTLEIYMSVSNLDKVTFTAEIIEGIYATVEDLEELKTLTGESLNSKVDKITGKTLSTNDFTTEYKDKLDNVESGAEINQASISNVKVGTNIIRATSKTDTLEIEAGTNVTITTDLMKKKIIISSKDTTYQVATTSKKGLMSIEDKTKLDEIEESANNYTHPDTHPASMITQDNMHKFVTDDEKTKWNNMLSSSGGTVDGDTEFKNNKIDILTLTRKDTANGAAIKYQNNAKVLGYLGFDGSGNPVTWEGNSPTVSSMHTLLTSKNYDNYAAQKEHTHDNYLQLTGGNISGLTSFSQGIRGYTLSSSASHGKGQTGWSHAFKITTTGIYQNQFMKFSIVQRNRMGKMYIRLVSNTTAGTVNVGEFCTVGNIKVAYVCEDNALDVYIYKSEAYDEIDCMITQKGSYMNGTDITWVDTVVSALPEGAVAAISNTNDTFTFTASRDGGTALVLDNTNSSDDRTYVSFKNKGQSAGYLSMSGNDLYTYKNSTNCKVLDTDNFNDSVSLKKVFTFNKESYGGTCSVYRYGMIIAVCVSGLWATGNTNVLIGDTNFVGVGNQKHYVDENGNCIQFTAGGEIYLCVKSSQGNSILSTSFSATALFMIHSA